METEDLPKKRKKESSHWWEGDQEDQSSIKWMSLEHHGLFFPPLYQPHGVPLVYNGEPIYLTPEQEEIATMWASVVGTEWETKEIFRKNFESSFLKILGENHKIKSLNGCDFKGISMHIESQRELKKLRPSEEKKTEREAKQKIIEEMGYAIVDNTREKISNIIVEPPGLFRGRGQHPKGGNIKGRLAPEDITINIGKRNKVPICPLPGHSWKFITHNNTTTWLAFYEDPELSFSSKKYVYLSAASKFKGLSDKLKYEKAKKLKEMIDEIRADYNKKILSDSSVNKQLGSALYLIDKLALRVGNEKTEDEADTVGCCSLRVEHIKFEKNHQITLDFLGKDSMRYFNTVQIVPEVYNNLKEFCKGKEKENDLFDLITAHTLNGYLRSFMHGLSAKMFRTYNASISLQQQLAKFKAKNQSVEEKVQFYTDANREVAILCNHQKSTPKNFEGMIEKLQEKLKEKLEDIRILEDHMKFIKTGRNSVDTERKLPCTEENTKKALAKAKTAVKNMEIKLKMKDDNKTIALQTSKINYMDPRITVAWCKKNEVPIEKVFAKTLRAKFIWAMYAETTWEF
ncbi:unnamed protein product [Blepharisma stoltei]|uniref:DNA topoisomerase I n=1 Tax=Blepharisma stoltei TaxID=1481888 RepID=A0AAU9IGM8_9CILI|nr:unnamed protein product [Blepharisma stoltei]